MLNMIYGTRKVSSRLQYIANWLEAAYFPKSPKFKYYKTTTAMDLLLGSIRVNEVQL